MTNAAFYAGLRSTAARLLGDKGQQMTLRQRVSGAYTPGQAVTVTETDHTVTGAVFPYSAILVDGTRVRVGDKRVLLAAEGMTVEPDQDDRLQIGSVWHAVIAVKPVSPGGEVVVYELQVRK